MSLFVETKSTSTQTNTSVSKSTTDYGEKLRIPLYLCVLRKTERKARDIFIRVLPADHDVLNFFEFNTLLHNPSLTQQYKHKSCFLENNNVLREYKIQLHQEGTTSSQLIVTTDLKTRETKVVKVIPKKKLKAFAGDEHLWKTLCEKLLLLTPQHPGLMHLTDVIETPKNFYIYSERLEGGELFSFLLNENAIQEELCKYIIRQILEAVDFLHRNNLIHRDIKPENIMLRHPRVSWVEKETCLSSLDCYHVMTPKQLALYYELALIDFDTCQMTDISDQAYRDVSGGRRRLVGTYGYLAPEILSGHAYTRASDLWSVGVILYILMTVTCSFYNIFVYPGDALSLTHINDFSKNFFYYNSHIFVKFSISFHSFNYVLNVLQIIGVLPTQMELMVNAQNTLEIFQNMKTKKIDFNAESFRQFPLARELCSQLLEFNPKRRISTAQEALRHPWLFPLSPHAITREL
ncbi:mitogen-activated protein kinase 1-like isoform X2 [Hylaeus volcanicus]|uniref:mitogen-activated protein kinase 1-like isoform X2 n=1 Tax=Hylaeus volcanicus TaxID=313075 RepID=UPI0023B7772D|nr:mitogen-activated protein kinase 1-like isoform X2 [Hylaeus volcanicus]